MVFHFILFFCHSFNIVYFMSIGELLSSHAPKTITTLQHNNDCHVAFAISITSEDGAIKHITIRDLDFNNHVILPIKSIFG